MAGDVENLETLDKILQVLTSPGRSNGETKLLDLPSVVLVSVLTRVSDPVDISCLLCSCHFLRTLIMTVPFFLRLRPWEIDETCEEVARSGAWTRAALTGIRSQMACTRVLDVSGCWVLDEDVTSILADLKELECLILDGCQKLTSSVADALAVSVRSGPQALSLQRCFRLGPTAAGNLLAAAAADGSRLHCILLSHLDRLELPRESPLLDVQEKTIVDIVVPARPLTSSNAGLRILALHNCGSLGAFELATMATTCPLLEFLLLGGSGEGLGLCRAETLRRETVDAAVAALLSLVDSLKNLHILEITFFTSTVYQALREQVCEDIHIWDLCDENTALSVSSIISGPKTNTDCRMSSETSTAELFLEFLNSNYTYLLYPCLTQRTKALEMQCGHAMLALRAAANCVDIRKRTPLHVAASLGNCAMVSSLLTIGALTVGMKDSAGATALFVAAECGHFHVCELLLKGGANVLAMNRAGETPLYIAALRGHCAAVETMLSHCKRHAVNWQDPDAYGDGWTPLMAAAVADRQDVAMVLLKAAGADIDFSYTGLQSNKQPGADGAELAHTMDVSLKDNILQCGTFIENNVGTVDVSCLYTTTNHPSKLASPCFLNAQNRYGQTALHIAARRASLWFVINLLRAGASRTIRDEYGRRAVDAALRQNHVVVVEILRHWETQYQVTERFGLSRNITSSKGRWKASSSNEATFHLKS